MTSSLVCISGGIDSIVLLKRAINCFDSISCLTFHYPSGNMEEDSIIKLLKGEFDFEWYDVQLINNPSFMTMVGIGLDICHYSNINSLGFGIIKDDLMFDDINLFRGSESFFHQISRIARYENINNIDIWLPLKDMSKTEVISELKVKNSSIHEIRCNYNFSEWKFKEM